MSGDDLGDLTSGASPVDGGPLAEPRTGPPVDLEAIAADLADVEIALARLENGSYWTDEVTGAPLPESLLEVSPTARRQPGA